MGLLDSLLEGSALSDLTALVRENPQIVQAVASLLDPDDGSVGQGFGLDDLLGALRGGGQADAVSSWLGQGENLAVSPEDFSASLPPDLLSQFASKAGVEPSQAGSVLAGVLPKLVDQLSPQGSAPGGSSLGGLLGGLMSGGRD